MDALGELAALEAADRFVSRHIGPSEAEIAAMLATVGAASLDDLIGQAPSPRDIRANTAARPAAGDRRGRPSWPNCAPWPPNNVVKIR